MISDSRFAPLPSELKRRRLLAEHEAVAGVVWRDDCPPDVGRKISGLIPRLTNREVSVYRAADDHRIVGSSSGVTEVLSQQSLGGEGDDNERLDAVAAVVYAFVHLAAYGEEESDDPWDRRYEQEPRYEADRFVDSVNDTLLAARVEWHFSEGHFVQRGNSVLYTEVVKPASILLDNHPKFVKASAGFQAAITRLSEGKPDVAITDAASALQEFFRALGVKGNSVSDQLVDAEKRKLITPYDYQLLKPFTGWVNADRSNRGNAHNYREGDVSKADAWLAVHVAGALMIRLSNEEPRDILAARAKRDAEAAAAKEAEEERLRVEAAARVAASSAEPWNTPGNFSDDTPF